MGLLDGLADQAKSMLGDGGVDGALDKVEKLVDEKTGHKFDDQVDAASDQVKEKLGGNAD